MILPLIKQFAQIIIVIKYKWQAEKSTLGLSDHLYFKFPVAIFLPNLNSVRYLLQDLTEIPDLHCPDKYKQN